MQRRHRAGPGWSSYTRAAFVVGALALGAGTAGCRRKANEPAVTATGTIIFQPEALTAPGEASGTDRRSFLRTQEELLNARTMSEGVAAQLGLTGAPERLVSGRAQGATWILEVRAHHPDPDVSRRACNAALDLFLTQRGEGVRAPLEARQRALAARLNALPEDAPERAALRHDLELLALRLTSAPADAHVLEACHNVSEVKR